MNENHNYQAQTYSDVISIIKIVKWTFLPYLAFQFLLFLHTLGKHPTNLLEATIFFIELSGWGYIIVGGPFVLIGVGINYFMRQTILTNIPQDTTLYEAVTQSTLMVGNVKVIVPKIDEEMMEIIAGEEELVDSILSQ
ncbi:MAG: hypothetical protein ACW98F_04100 [Candidatus Hodarchaeales archaeon]|jgi:hypothetical protein